MRTRYKFLLLSLMTCASLVQSPAAFSQYQTSPSGQQSPGTSSTQQSSGSSINQQSPGTSSTQQSSGSSSDTATTPGSTPSGNAMGKDQSTSSQSTDAANKSTMKSSGSSASSLQPIKEGNVTYVSGGAGKEEVDSLKQMANKYPLEVVLMQKAKPTDEYTAEVPVVVSDSKGNEVLNLPAAGPYLLLDLPKGKYTIKAGKEGDAKRRTVTVGRKHQRVVFQLPQG